MKAKFFCFFFLLIVRAYKGEKFLEIFVILKIFALLQAVQCEKMSVISLAKKNKILAVRFQYFALRPEAFLVP